MKPEKSKQLREETIADIKETAIDYARLEDEGKGESLLENFPHLTRDDLDWYLRVAHGEVFLESELIERHNQIMERYLKRITPLN